MTTSLGLPQDIEGIIGGSGPDSLTGNRASNRLEGGPGNDTLRGNDGADQLVGGADGDTIFARDGTLDLISCGPNRTGKSPRRDTLDSDLADGTPPADCETVTQGALREGPNVRMSGRPLWPRRDGRVGIRLRCPGKLAIGCKGTLRLRLLPITRKTSRGQASARSSAYRLAAGRSKWCCCAYRVASGPPSGARAGRLASARSRRASSAARRRSARCG